MSATQLGLSLLYIALAVICYAAGWWQGKTVERDRSEKRGDTHDQGDTQDQLVQRGQEPVVLVRRQPIRAQ